MIDFTDNFGKWHLPLYDSEIEVLKKYKIPIQLKSDYAMPECMNLYLVPQRVVDYYKMYSYDGVDKNGVGLFGMTFTEFLEKLLSENK